LDFLDEEELYLELSNEGLIIDKASYKLNKEPRDLFEKIYKEAKR
jgi:hypothetical protein